MRIAVVVLLPAVEAVPPTLNINSPESDSILVEPSLSAIAKTVVASPLSR